MKTTYKAFEVSHSDYHARVTATFDRGFQCWYFNLDIGLFKSASTYSWQGPGDDVEEARRIAIRMLEAFEPAIRAYEGYKRDLASCERGFSALKTTTMK